MIECQACNGTGIVSIQVDDGSFHDANCSLCSGRGHLTPALEPGKFSVTLITRARSEFQTKTEADDYVRLLREMHGDNNIEIETNYAEDNPNDLFDA
jgi:excinuclease UvrABC ATPase subunit